MEHASVTFTLDPYIHKTETMMDGIKEKLENRNKAKKTSSQKVVKTFSSYNSDALTFSPLAPMRHA